MRKWYIFTLCHFYPVFIVLHLLFGDRSRVSQVIFSIVPLIVFGSLYRIWLNTSSVRLVSLERYSIGYLVFMLFVISLYYCICIYATPAWVYSHNLQAAGFVGLTLLFYFYATYEPK